MISHKFSIRRANKGDALKISLLKKQTFKKINFKDYPKKNIDFLCSINSVPKVLEKLRCEEVFLAVNEDDELLGTISLNHDKIEGLFIRFDLTDHDIGSSLLFFVEDYAKSRGLKKIHLFSTKRAVPFYEKEGYRLINEFVWKPKKGLLFKIFKMEKRL